MSDHSITNLPASVRQRLLNLSRTKKDYPTARVFTSSRIEIICSTCAG